MSVIVDQPPPIASTRRPTWEVVMAHVEQTCSSERAALVLSDMRERDAVGRERYGTPLTSGNGRNHLVDAYQECLDAVVYLANELDEYDVGPATKLEESSSLLCQTRSRLQRVQQLFTSQLRTLFELRDLIEGGLS